MIYFSRRWPRAAWLCLLWLLVAIRPAHAHDPFDGNILMGVSDNTIRVKVTLGFDASRDFLASAGVTPMMASSLKRDADRAGSAALPLEVADQLVTLEAGTTRLKPSACLIAFDDAETYYVAVYPRPSGNTVQLRARYFAVVEYMRPGLLVSLDAQRRVLARQSLSRAQPVATAPLTMEAAREAAGPDGFIGFFRLGVEHILTGFDHLLFLCALLLGVQKLRSMLAIITAFTISHSVTLALAALHLASAPREVVEPLIALSIIVACIENVRRRGTASTSCWLAGGFGLIHGFGFAGALREAGLGQAGNSIALPLLSFNLGVEAGQLLVAAMVIPLLLLGRRRQAFVRWGLPGLSMVIILVSSYWLIDRMG